MCALEELGEAAEINGLRLAVSVIASLEAREGLPMSEFQHSAVTKDLEVPVSRIEKPSVAAIRKECRTLC
jgi:hypothetical protein